MPTFPVRSPAKMNSPSGCGDVPSGERGGRFKNNSPSSYQPAGWTNLKIPTQIPGTKAVLQGRGK